MSVPATARLPMTAAEFLLIDNHGFELVAGVPQEKNVGMFSSTVSVWILGLLLRRFDWQKYGYFTDSEGGYQCWPQEPNRVRKPDIGFVRRDRLPGGVIPEGWCSAPPDFVVEVLSKNDTLEQTEDKVEEYLDAGVPLIWVVDPKKEEVHVYRGSLAADRLAGHDEVRDDVALPGFHCHAEELFPPQDLSHPA
jgi:Uma2 family endonuclease